MQITVRHQISIALGPGLNRAVQHLLLTPQSSSVQTVREWQVEIEGLDDPTGFIDAYGNRALLASQSRPPAEIVISISGLVETIDRNGVVGRVPGEPVPALFRRASPLAKPIGSIVNRLKQVPRTGGDRIGFLHQLMARVGEVLGGENAASQSQSQSQGDGSQSQSQSQGAAAPPPAVDVAHAFIGAARALDVPARFVSGYLADDSRDETGLHAWVEAWDDGLGWIGFDPLLGYCPTDRHIRLATGLDALSAAAVRAHPSLGSPSDLSLDVAAQ